MMGGSSWCGYFLRLVLVTSSFHHRYNRQSGSTVVCRAFSTTRTLLWTHNPTNQNPNQNQKNRQHHTPQQFIRPPLLLPAAAAPVLTVTALSSSSSSSSQNEEEATIETVDIVVIGSGIGGLSCAALLATAGKRVKVVEKHYEIGGCKFLLYDSRF